MTPEELFLKHTKKDMIRFNLSEFKQTHPRLFKAIIGAIEESAETSKTEPK
jgi:hypothetical protein